MGGREDKGVASAQERRLQPGTTGTHTAGPWAAVYLPDLKATLIGTADRATAFARMESFDGTPDADEQCANARLIAAAPELLEALRAVKEYDDFVPVLPRAVLEKLNAAIANASPIKSQEEEG